MVGYLGRPAGLVSKGGGMTATHVSGQYHKSLRILFVKEQSFPQTVLN